MVSFVSLIFLASHLTYHALCLSPLWRGKDGPSEAGSSYLSDTSEHDRAKYLESHSHSVAVFPGVISEDDASKLKSVIDRRWSHVQMSLVKQLEAQGGDGDNLVEMVDKKASYSADVVAGGDCSEDEQKQASILQKDCVLVQSLLQDHVTPLVKQKLKEFRDQGGAADLPDTLYACDSFVRRYVPGERHGIHPHRDTYSVLTANVLLSDPGKFQGGLVMFPEADKLKHETLSEQRGYLEDDDMGRGVFLEHGSNTAIGELIVHRGSHWHGVQMLEPEKSQRYSWITWYTPNKETCLQYQ